MFRELAETESPQSENIQVPDREPPSDTFKQSWADVSSEIQEQSATKKNQSSQERSPSLNCLEGLPEELLADIVSYAGERSLSYLSSARTPLTEIVCPSGIGTLYSLSLTNRLFHRLAQPILYHHCTRGRRFSYLRTLVTNPQLARYVKSIKFSLDKDRYPDLSKYSDTKKIVIDRMEKYDQEFNFLAAQYMRDHWNGDQGETDDAALTTILMHAPSIEAISIRYSHDIGNPGKYQPRWIEPIKLRFPHSFDKLKIAVFDHTELPLQTIEILLQLPSLQTLNMEWTNIHDEHPADFAPQSSTVQHLGIIMCPVRARVLLNLIETCKTLRSFMFEQMDDYCGDRALHDFHAILDRHNETLESVRFIIYDT
ncbi:hypothetical protein BS50DRAFT_570836 [Corynespora cassiicola Philippines]|uniref:F-box domain-containing protein n=1 Tax=Corynespora cassiicola Philippines TaxID=1448308 RepID=A0A2T2P1G7_CORCC|nr:hypothetical protein BS50DRAFT_570836 [Corynespora cassiicola Philippines]